jgi:hypothetical protein
MRHTSMPDPSMGAGLKFPYARAALFAAYECVCIIQIIQTLAMKGVCVVYVCVCVCMCVCVCVYACVYACMYVCQTTMVSACVSMAARSSD